jgi:hypothetical protein
MAAGPSSQGGSMVVVNSCWIVSGNEHVLMNTFDDIQKACVVSIFIGKYCMDTIAQNSELHLYLTENYIIYKAKGLPIPATSSQNWHLCILSEHALRRKYTRDE